LLVSRERELTGKEPGVERKGLARDKRSENKK